MRAPEGRVGRTSRWSKCLPHSGRKTCHQAAVGLPSTHHGAASILYRICPIALLPTSTDLSGLTPRSPAGYLGHGGSCAQTEVTTMNEGPSHLSFPSRASLVPAQSVALPRGRQRQAITAKTNPVLSSVLVQHTPISEPSCSHENSPQTHHHLGFISAQCCF